MITLLVYLAIIGLIAWLLTEFIPMDPKFKTLIIVVAIIFCLLLVLRAVGFGDLAVPQLR